MVEPGTKIKARVTDVEHYGVWLNYQGHKVLVLVPEFSWSPIQLKEAVRPGDELDVHVLRYSYKDHVIVGSVRRLQPESNPYRTLSRLPPETPLRGRVAGTSATDLRIELDDYPNACGYVRHPPESAPKVGEPVVVKIAALEPDEGQLTFVLEDGFNASSGHSAELLAQKG